MKRHGFSLTELMIAIALAAGPLLVALHLVNSNVRGARFNNERATMRLVLADLLELLSGETTAMLRAMTGDESEKVLGELLSSRISSMPDTARSEFGRQVEPLLGRMTATLTEDVNGVKGLALLTLRATLGDRTTVEVRRLFRPDARPGADLEPTTQD